MFLSDSKLDGGFFYVKCYCRLVNIDFIWWVSSSIWEFTHRSVQKHLIERFGKIVLSSAHRALQLLALVFSPFLQWSGSEVKKKIDLNYMTCCNTQTCINRLLLKFQFNLSRIKMEIFPYDLIYLRNIYKYVMFSPQFSHKCSFIFFSWWTKWNMN